MTNDPWVRPKSVLDQAAVWDHRYAVTLHLISVTGGTPSDPKIAKGWLAMRLGGDEMRDQLLTQKLQETMAQRLGQDPTLTPEQVQDEALEAASYNVNGFKRTPAGVLYLEGRHAKAMLKECTSIGLGSGKTPARLGLTKKGSPGFVAEHIQVIEDLLPISRDGVPVTEPDEVAQSFVHTWRGSSIDYSEVLHDVQVSFTIATDIDLTDLIKTVLVLGEQNGLGARRSQGSGKFVVTQFEKL